MLRHFSVHPVGADHSDGAMMLPCRFSVQRSDTIGRPNQTTNLRAGPMLACSYELAS